MVRVRNRKRDSTTATGDDTVLTPKHDVINYLSEDAATTHDVERQERPKTPRGTRLADRLGRGSVSDGEEGVESALLTFEQSIFDSLPVGCLRPRISAWKTDMQPVFITSREAEEALGSPQLSSFDFDEKISQLLTSTSGSSFGKDKKMAPLAPAWLCPRIIDKILTRMEKDSEFLPRRTFELLLQQRLVSDQAYPKLVEKLLKKKNTASLGLEYIKRVEDLHEQSLFAVIQFALEESESHLSSVKSLWGQRKRETLLINAFDCPFDASLMVNYVRGLPSEHVTILLQVLRKILVTHVHGSSIPDASSSNSVCAALPSLQTCIKWISGPARFALSGSGS